MKIKIIIGCSLLLLLFFLLSCQKLNYNLDNLYTGDKIVLNGFVDSELGCVVSVSKTSPSTGSFTKVRQVLNDAHVFLYQNGDSILELKIDTSGRYISKGFTPKTGAKYKIRATSLSLPACESAEEVFNDTIQTGKLTTSYSSSVDYGFPGVIFNFPFSFDSSKQNYYTIDVDNDVPNYYVYAIILGPAGVDATCDLFEDIISSKCLTSGDNVRIAVVLQDNGSINPTKPTILKLKISSISPIYFEYRKSLNQPRDIDFAFTEPNVLITNIKGGYGIFYTKNTTSLIYKF